MAVGRMDQKHIFRYPNIKRVKSWKKYQKAINWYIDLLKKEKKEWLTKRISNTRKNCIDRIKKYWISLNNINNCLKNKWMHLIEKI